jgi:tetratricopeptide (TPR) repeat protein
VQAKCAILDKKYDRTLELLDESNFKYQLLISQALLGKGIKHIPKESKSTLKERIVNPYFQRIKQILFPYSKKSEDTADLNLILGRMYLHEKDYGMAEVCLKKALAQDRYNARVYYNLSYLNVDRVKELKFKDRIDILEYCIKLDPGFSAAVYELANEYYTTGTGVPTSSGTQNAIASLQAFLKINPNQPDILSLLGKIYVQSKYTREAVSTYTRLLDLYPNVAENNYNLGICYFHMKDYKRAEELFQKAIEISDYSDSYLYLGAIYRLSEDWDRALYYFRERIKRKEGADDRYAKEAMRGVRIILSKQQGDSSEEIGNY